MKKKLIQAWLPAMLLAFSACNKEELEPIGPGVGTMSALYDAGRVESVVCHSMDTVDLQLLQEGYFNPTPDEKERFDSIRKAAIHHPLNYENLRVMFSLRTSEETPEVTYNKKEKEGIEKYNRFIQEISIKVRPGNAQIDSLEQALAQRGIMRTTGLYPSFFTARINGTPSITANHTLFGQPSGTDLSSHFAVEGPSWALPRGMVTDFGFLFWYDAMERPTSLADYFAQDTWLQSSYVFRFQDVPEEEYENLTLYISLPTTFEYWYEYFRTGQPEVRTEQRGLSASCHIQMGLSSHFDGL